VLTSILERKYPVGIDDFAEMKAEKYFHWDRSLFIRDFMEISSKVLSYFTDSCCLVFIHVLQNTLILRPRRWGKSLTMSMVKYFFDASEPELAKELFATSRLAEEDPSFVDQHCGKWPVVFITFASCTAETWADMKSMLISIIADAYRMHRYLLDDEFLFPDERKPFEAILNRDPTALYQVALKDLTALLFRYYKKRVIVLIDEYDKPMHSAFENKYLDSAVPFLSSAITCCLKSNVYVLLDSAVSIPFSSDVISSRNLEKGLITGILKVAKYGYLSGLNNLVIYSALDQRFNTIFGVNEAEVHQALAVEGLSERFDQVRDLYYGYDIAGTSDRTFNPWSMLNYLNDKVLKPYWVKAGGTDKYVVNALFRSDEDDLKRYEALLSGQQVTVPFRDDFRFDQIDDSISLWSLLFHGGYLTGHLESGNLVGRIPNKEVLEEFGHIWRDYFVGGKLRTSHLSATKALLAGDALTFERELRQLAREVFR